MTPFNGSGDWALGTLGNSDSESITYRACKNSRDRNEDATSKGSLALLCITIHPSENLATLGLWHSEVLAKPGENLACSLKLDQDRIKTSSCKMKPSHFGNGQIVISRYKQEIANILSHETLEVGLAKLNGKQMQQLIFDMDRAGLQKTAQMILDFF